MTLASLSLHAQNSPLDYKKKIERAFPKVPWINVETLAKRVRSEDHLLILDARKSEEFAVSHIFGAVRVDPDAPKFNSLLLPKDRDIVVYCSVGYRSAKIASELQKLGYERVFNLLGGIFQWANRGQPVFQGKTAATKVHGYNKKWGRLLKKELRDL